MFFRKRNTKKKIRSSLSNTEGKIEESSEYIVSIFTFVVSTSGFIADRIDSKIFPIFSEYKDVVNDSSKLNIARFRMVPAIVNSIDFTPLLEQNSFIKEFPIEGIVRLKAVMLFAICGYLELDFVENCKKPWGEDIKKFVDFNDEVVTNGILYDLVNWGYISKDFGKYPDLKIKLENELKAITRLSIKTTLNTISKSGLTILTDKMRQDIHNISNIKDMMFQHALMFIYLTLNG